MASASRSRHLGLVIRVLLVAVVLAAGVGLASFPVSTFFDQRSELRDLQAQRRALVEQIDSIDVQIARRVGPDGVAKAAKCVGLYVEPGSEVYSVPGVEGCVAVP